MKTPKGWHRRGYLPHFDGGEITQFITFRLYDSLPQNILNSLKNTSNDDNLENQRRAERFLDQGFGECFLKIPQVAEIVQNKLLAMREKDFLLKS